MKLPLGSSIREIAMMPSKSLRTAAALCLSAALACAPRADAQWAVIDASAIRQLVQQVQTLQQQLATARSQLQQATQTLQAMSGDRGMERLLAGTVRNYLPANWSQVNAALQGGGGALGSDVRALTGVDAVLGARALAALPPDARGAIASARAVVALRQAVAREALVVNSSRFASLQTLINAIGGAADQKAILDLQARIGAESTMLQNEQSKLQVLFQAAEAEQSADAERERERIVAGHGLFATRFQPVPGR
jgi:type IV secretion system protein VirB5